jgi:hypothetical protein
VVLYSCFGKFFTCFLFLAVPIGVSVRYNP